MGVLVFFFCVAQALALQSAPDLNKEKQSLIKTLFTARGLRSSYFAGRLRMKLLNTAERAARVHNANTHRHFNMNLNEFSIMTKEEKQLHLGLDGNLTDGIPVADNNIVKRSTAPPSYSHREKGHVTEVKSQGSCGACWAFSAIGAFEGAYSIATGITKSFSVQEALDCSYDKPKDGCKGGWYSAAWRYIGRSRRLAEMRHAPYTGRVGDCKWGDSTPNGIKNSNYVSYYSGKSNIEKIVAMSTPAVAFTVEDDFFGYSDGLYDGCPENKKVNHGVILVGYTQDHWEAKNSWGKHWGTEGFVKFSRVTHDNICNLLSYVTYPVIVYQDKGEFDQADIVPENDLKLISHNKNVYVDKKTDVIVTMATDGDKTTCVDTSVSDLPTILLDLEKPFEIQKLKIITTVKEGFIGAKLHIGEKGNFFDKRVAVISEDDFETEDTIELSLSQTVKGRYIYMEHYQPQQQPRKLTFCEMLAFAKPQSEDEEDGVCPAGTVECDDGVCRHSHMCHM